jgi:hypothetical protein
MPSSGPFFTPPLGIEQVSCLVLKVMSSHGLISAYPHTAAFILHKIVASGLDMRFVEQEHKHMYDLDSSAILRMSPSDDILNRGVSVA